MCNNNFGGCGWIILLILIVFCFNTNGCDSGCGNGCGCGCRD